MKNAYTYSRDGHKNDKLHHSEHLNELQRTFIASSSHFNIVVAFVYAIKFNNGFFRLAH